MAFFWGFIIALFVSVASIPIIIKVAIKFGFVDEPNHRKVHSKAMPRIGGLAIIFGTISALLYLKPSSPYLLEIAIGAAILITIGLIDDRYPLSARVKLFGQLLSAIIVVSSGLTIDYMNIPFFGDVQFGIWSYPISIGWILIMINSINLIDGLDGLAGGVSTIATSTILLMALMSPGAHFTIIAFSIAIIGSTLGFLIFNFHPAKIFMGDTGSLFLGYGIAIISMLGFFKSVTIFSLIIPILILGVPILDTSFAIVRRFLNKQKISDADKGHLHHCLLNMGFDHRKTVFIIYGMSLAFSGAAIMFSRSTLWVSILSLFILMAVVQVFAECIGLIGKRRKPLINAFKRLSTVAQVYKRTE
ncbi:glycosyltransferase family 4 protein [Alkalihalobacillus trypoxylicola]|uniref:glycosyltransferase family 4 protein n=1 Tax=Alkalihalobacillus trypoxylicola TaxID=519424 RepID=UPI000ADED5BC|nr:MraY family glycosyltransferase [Alkalihalobacillus trypoxylicola]